MKNHYIPEVDALRGISVICIIFYHFGITMSDDPILKSGFIGVDIFIVISGYLITKLLINKNFTYIDFIEKRSRRLFPALLLLMIITIILSYFFLLPQSFANLGQSILANIFFISNFLFFYQSNYWEFPIHTKPLLHTWSLSLELQFYIFILLIFFFRNKIIRNIILCLSISIILLLFPDRFNFNENFSKNFFNDYFLIFGRLWEFLIGSLTAIFLNIKGQFKNCKINDFFKITGIILLLISLTSINSAKNYPNLLTLLPVTGTAMILLSSKTNNNYFIFNNSILIHLGKISYSLYLWHFPIFIFFIYNSHFKIVFWQQIFSLIVIYLFSLASYNFIEIPFYKKKLFDQKKFFILLFFLTIIIFFFSLLISKKIIFPKSNLKYKEVIEKFPEYNFLKTPKRDLLENQFTNSEKVKILICGDSQGFNLAYTLQSNPNIINKYEIEFLGFKNCLEKKNKTIEKANYILSSTQINGRLYNTFEDIKKLNQIITEVYIKKFVIVSQSIEFQTDSDLLLNYLILSDIKQYNIKENINIINKFFYENRKSYVKSNNKNLFNLSKKLNVIFLDKSNYICDEKNKLCFGLDPEGKKTFFDYTHITYDGAIFFGNIIDKTNWLKLN